MALNTFGWTPAEVTTDSAGNVIAGVTLTVFTDVTKANQVTGLFDKDGVTALPSGVVTSDVKGRFGFKASDAFSMLYVWDGSTSDPWPIAAHEALDAGMASHAQAVADAQAAADAAAASAQASQNSAALVGSPAGSAMDTYMGGSASNLVTTVAGKVAKGDLVLNVKDYGATGNGSTDDTTAIQSALTAARTAKARLRFEFNKTYIVSATLDPRGVHVDGYGATIKVKPAITQNFNVLQAYAGFTVTDLTIDLNKANTTDPASSTSGAGVYVSSASGWADVVTLRNVKILNGYQCAVRMGTTSAATDPTAVSASRARIENLVVDSCKWGVYLQNTAGVSILNPEISNTAADGLFDYFSNGTQIIGGRVSNVGGHGVVTQYSHAFHCSGVSVNVATGGGITVGGGSTTLDSSRNFTIIGNRVKGATLNGFSVDTTKTGAATTPVPTYGVMSGNVSDGNGIHGFYFHNAQYLSATGNVARNNTGVNAGGIAFDGKNLAITGNTLVGNATGIKFQGDVAGYGFHEVGNNVIVGSTVAAQSFSAYGADGTALTLTGQGAPAVAAPVGSIYRRTDGGAVTTLYVKESGGVTSSGWVAK